MTTQELIEQLSDMPPHYPVVIRNGDSEIDLSVATIMALSEVSPLVVINIPLE